jgi:hypothetical protein
MGDGSLFQLKNGTKNRLGFRQNNDDRDNVSGGSWGQNDGTL